MPQNKKAPQANATPIDNGVTTTSTKKADATSQSTSKADAAKRSTPKADATTVPLKESLQQTKAALGHTAEVLGADLKAATQHRTETARDKLGQAAVASTNAAKRVPRPAIWTAAGIGVAAAGAGVVAKWLQSRRAARKPWWKKLPW